MSNTSAINKIKSHFQASVSNDLSEGYVEELDLKFWFYQTYPFKDEQKIMELSSKGKVVESVVETILVKARNADGSRMFTPADRASLMNEADPKLLIKMAGIINTVEDLSDEDVVKN